MSIGDETYRTYELKLGRELAERLDQLSQSMICAVLEAHLQSMIDELEAMA